MIMKVIDYNELLREHKPKGYVSNDADTIANTLIRQLCIQAGSGLARFLNVDTCFDNHMAVRVWVQKQLDNQESYFINETCCQLESELYDLLPNMS